MTKFLTGIIVVLLAIILLQRACTPSCTDPVQNYIYSKDTVSIHDTSIMYRKVRLSIHDTTYIPTDTIYKVDTSCEVTKGRFIKLVKSHVSTNIYVDTILVDTIGYVRIYDTIQFNKLKGRGLKYRLVIPNQIQYVPVPAAPKRQLYVGGGLMADGTSIAKKALILNAAEVGLLYKNKKDQMYGAKAQVDFKGNVSYGVQTYWKLRLK
jgi:hypothetical protein